jgi:replicative DNA helicase
VILEAIRWTEVIFVDYLQQVRLSNKINRNLAIWDLTTSLKQIAIKYWISVICLSQLNRSWDRTQEPSLKLLRDSWSIEQDSDVVIFLHGYDDHERTAGVYIKKNRHWELASFHLPYIKKYFYMYNKY